MTEGSAPIDLRLLTYNVHGLRAGTGAVSRVIRSVAPDVACLQEAPARIRWRTRSAEVARRSGVYVVAGGRPSAGNLLLCSPRVDVVSSSADILSRTRGLPARGLTCVVLAVSGVRFGVIGVHLGLHLGERRQHAEEVAAAVARLRAVGVTAVMVAGDLNALPHADALAPLRAAGLVDAGAGTTAWHTFPASAPTARIDAVFVSAELQVISCTVPDIDPHELTRASDHRPVLAVLRLP